MKVAYQVGNDEVKFSSSDELKRFLQGENLEVEKVAEYSYKIIKNDTKEN